MLAYQTHRQRSKGSDGPLLELLKLDAERLEAADVGRVLEEHPRSEHATTGKLGAVRKQGECSRRKKDRGRNVPGLRAMHTSDNLRPWVKYMHI